MLGIYNYTVVLTYFGMLVSFTGITFALHDDTYSALICLMISGVCDMFDGKVASTKKRTVQEKKFGIQIDSLSDLICFGALPAIIVYKLCSESSIGFYISGIYLLAALIRLAYFNVTEEERQEQTQGSRKHYLGLPVTLAALIFPVFIGLGKLFSWNLEVLCPIVAFLTALAFLLPFSLRKPALPGKISMLLCGGAELAILVAGADL